MEMPFRGSVAAFFICAATAITAQACSDSTTPTEKPDQPEPPRAAIEVVSRPIADTTGTPPHDSLVVVVRVDGRRAAAEPVRFVAVREVNTAWVHLSAGGREYDALDLVTDASGRAAALVGVGDFNTGVGAIRVEVPSLSVSTTVQVTTLAGAATAITNVPVPVIVGVQRETTVAARLTDRHYLFTQGAISCRTVRGYAEVRSGCTVAGVRVGYDTLVVSSGTLSVRGSIHVLPKGTIAADLPRDWRTVVGDSDGSGATTLTKTVWPVWLPAGDSLVVARADDLFRTHLWVVDRTGAGRALVPSFATSLGEAEPSVSADGAWIYFVARRASGEDQVWRVRRNGTGAELVAAPPFGWYYRSPSPSPDGRFVAFRAEAGGPWDIRILDLGTGAVRTLATPTNPAYGPAWSPTGEWIALAGYGGDLYLVRPDGSETRSFKLYAGSASWSPDGSYLLLGPSDRYDAGPLTILEVATGLTFKTSLRGGHASWAY